MATVTAAQQNKAYDPDSQRWQIASMFNGPGGLQGYLGQSAYQQSLSRKDLATNQQKYDNAQKAKADAMAPIPAPTRDPRITALEQSQRELAKRYRDNMGTNIEGEFGEYTRDRSRELAGEREHNDASFNRRGLLGSGMNQGANSDSGMKATRDIQDKRLEIGDRYRQTADELDNEPIQTEIALAGGSNQVGAAAQQASKDLQDLTLQNRQNRQNALEGLFEAGGSALGTYLGKPAPTQDSAADWAQNTGNNDYLDYYYGT